MLKTGCKATHFIDRKAMASSTAKVKLDKQNNYDLLAE
jgi:hypothetical protein